MKSAPGNICPTCGGDVPNTEHKGKYPGALSRVDNETEICSRCGLSEGVSRVRAAYWSSYL